MTTLEKLIYLKEHGMSLRYIAKKAECSPQMITNIINRNANFSSRMERSLVEAVEKIKKEIAEVE